MRELCAPLGWRGRKRRRNLVVPVMGYTKMSRCKWCINSLRVVSSQQMQRSLTDVAGTSQGEL
eukprot:1380358-Amphidinium_carterae.1